MKENKPNIYSPKKKLICDWTNEKKCLTHYRILNIYDRGGMVVEKVHEKNSFR